MYQLTEVNAGEDQVSIQQEDDRFQLLGENGSLERLFAGRKVQAQKHWLCP
jgi:hypothetical protein